MIENNLQSALCNIREFGRYTQGVKLVNLDAGDKLQAIASVIGEDAGETPAAGEPGK